METRLEEVGDGLWAYLQLPGAWGASNAGWIASDDAALLVDTLFDRAHTERMLHAFRGASAARVDTVVNTHANGDHCFGNEVVGAGRIIASRNAAEEMADMTPKKLALLMRLARGLAHLRPSDRERLASVLRRLRVAKAADLVDASPFVAEIFDAFDFRGLALAAPTETFSDLLELDVGGRAVRLMELGPAHTRGDVAVHVPDAGVVYVGDLLFRGAHPIVWEGPLSRWADACETLIALKPRVVVPGHGRLASTEDLVLLREYLGVVEREARRYHAEGRTPIDAATALTTSSFMEPFAGWSEAERLVINVRTAYRHLGDPPVVDPVALFAEMARFRARLSSRTRRVVARVS